jgi:peroxiredoxin
MMIRTSLIAMGVCVALLASVSAEEKKTLIGKDAPDFSAQATDGSEVTLGTFKDAKVTVVCFTCNGCPVAKAYVERFSAFAKKYQDQGVKFVAINCNYTDDMESMKKLAEENSLPYICARDESGNSARAFGATATPHLFVIGADGKIAYQGAFDDDMSEPKTHFVADTAEALLAGKPAPHKATAAVGCGIKLKKQ